MKSLRLVSLPRFNPMPLVRLHQAFDHPDWLFELKYDGFRALAYIENGSCRLLSRNRNYFKRFPTLCEDLARALPDRELVLDGEIVCLDRHGRPQFNPLLYRRDEAYLYAFDAIWVDGRDLRSVPLVERKQILRGLVPPQPSRLLYADYVEAEGAALFAEVCRRDLEGVVAKWKYGTYRLEPISWIKIKNPRYSQSRDRHERFERFKQAAGH